MITETQKEGLNRVIARQPFPLLIVTVSGAHPYGFPSIDSDYDLRGVHLLLLEKIVSAVTLRSRLLKQESA